MYIPLSDDRQRIVREKSLLVNLKITSCMTLVFRMQSFNLLVLCVTLAYERKKLNFKNSTFGVKIYF